MKISKLLILGTVLLAMGLALPTLADESQAPAADVPAVETPETMPQPEEAAASEPMSETPAETAASEPLPEMPAETAASEPMPEMPAEAATSQPMLEAAPEAAEAAQVQQVDETEPWAAEAPSEETPTGEPAGEAEIRPTTVQLGAVGYDEEGRPGRIHVVAGGDTLWDISDAYLGTPWVWPSIWQDNPDIVNPHRIYPGDHIWITPSEMRKVTPAEAEALLAGGPAEDELTEPASQDLAGVDIPGPAALVETEQPRLRISDREKVGMVSAGVVEAAASILTNVEPRMMISQQDRVYVGLGAGDVVEGDEFTVFRVQEKVFDPGSGELLGYHVNFLGWIEVVDVNADSSMALVRESAAEMVRGDKLVARRQPLQEIPLAPAPEDVEGQISFLPNSRTEMGMLDYVYLNRGTLDGVEVGSPLQVYRKGFAVRDDIAGRDRQIPDRVVADLVVVRAAPEASVAFVRHTEEELARGDYFRGAGN